MTKKGDKLYTPSMIYISRGEDDIQGGIATVKEITSDMFVRFEELPGRSFNLQYILDNQEKWSKIYEGKIARPDPDINTPFIESGDIVNGQKYNGPDIW